METAVINITETVESKIRSLGSLYDKADEEATALFDFICSNSSKDLTEVLKRDIKEDIDFYIRINDDPKAFILNLKKYL